MTVRWKSWDKLTFGLLTLLYGSVALLALNIVSYQELRSSTLSAAMTALNIDLGVFTTLRSIVIVGTIALFYLIEDKANQIYGLGHASSLQQVRIVEADTEQPKQIERPGSNEQQLTHRVTQEDEGLTQEATQADNPTTQESNPDNLTYLRVMSAYRELTKQGQDVSAAKIVEVSGVGLSSAKKYLRQIREQA